MPSLRDVAYDGMVVYIYYTTAAGNSISSQLGSSCQGNSQQVRYGKGRRRAAVLDQPSSLRPHWAVQCSVRYSEGRRVKKKNDYFIKGTAWPKCLKFFAACKSMRLFQHQMWRRTN